jgi:hypothetical protein
VKVALSAQTQARFLPVAPFRPAGLLPRLFSHQLGHLKDQMHIQLDHLKRALPS